MNTLSIRCALGAARGTCPCEPAPAHNFPTERTMDDDYEVPSPHEHAVDEAVEHATAGLTQKIALMTAVLATIGALISYQSGTAETEAMFLKNESILKQAKASDEWALYQAKSVKGYIADSTSALATDPVVKAKFAAQKVKEDQERPEIQAEAKKLQDEAQKLNAESEAKLRPHERLALALSFIQVAVALAAITVLTRKNWLLWGSVGSAVVGIGAALSALVL